MEDGKPQLASTMEGFPDGKMDPFSQQGHVEHDP